jgi:hypothetical protein
MHLQNSASTARVLNLFRTAKRCREDPTHAKQPLFQHPQLNRCIIVKHRLRAQEAALFEIPRGVATKIIVPIDSGDLKVGGRSIFVGEKQFADVMRETFGQALQAGSKDALTIELIDGLPSLDPFLLREHLKQNGLTVAPCYFEISEADMQRMFTFVQGEMQGLMTLTFGDHPGMATHAQRLVRKLLMSASDADLAPLRETLRLEQQEYEEGMFCWRGFLYYKWVLSDLRPLAVKAAAEIRTIMPRGPQDDETRAYISAVRPRLCDGIVAAGRQADSSLAAYDRAYKSLTNKADPAAFRGFLLSAPAMFRDLGERLGALQHLTTFWRYRFPHGAPRAVSPDELVDIFQDFEDALSFHTGAPTTALAS